MGLVGDQGSDWANGCPCGGSMGEPPRGGPVLFPDQVAGRPQSGVMVRATCPAVRTTPAKYHCATEGGERQESDDDGAAESEKRTRMGSRGRG